MSSRLDFLFRKANHAAKLVPSLAAAMLCFASVAPIAVYGQAVPRIQGPISKSALTTLKGNTIAVANARNDLGRVSDARPTGRMLLSLRRSPEQQSALDTLIAAQQNPRSPSYHKWTSTAEFAKQFGVADADIQSVAGYLASEGFSVTRVLPDKMAIEFSGTMGQLRNTFKTEIHSFSSEGKTFFANDRDPQIPAALAAVVAGVPTLSNYEPARRQLASAQNITLGGGRSGSKVHANYTDTNYQLESISPGDIAKIYDIPASANGAGVTIGLLGSSSVNLTYLQNYRTTFGLGTKSPAVIIDGTDPGQTSDNSINVAQLELVSAVAPAANINYYTSANTDLATGLNQAFIRAVVDNAVQILILSQENCEANLGVTVNDLLNTVSEEAAAFGITVIAPSGDGGATECDSLRGYGNPNTTEAASKGLAINGYAASPFVTAVGATDFYYTPAQQSQPGFLCCWNQTNGTTSYTSALGYIAEQPWNDSNNATNAEPFSILLASGGGISTVGYTTDGITAVPYPEPAWQQGVVPNAISTANGTAVASRAIPDVSIFGGDGNNASLYMICIQANECIGGSPGTLNYEFAGGTGTAVATFGGIAALVVQAHGPQGNINPTLYSTYTHAPAAFHDVQIGTNAVACTAGSPDCGGDGYTTGYAAGPGYDAASGLGSVDVAQLIASWTPPNTTPSSTAFTITALNTTTPITSFKHGTVVQGNITVTGSGGTPTGNVGVIMKTANPGNAAVELYTLANGSVLDNSGGLSDLSGGTHQVYARYAGDATYAPSLSAPLTLSISPESSKVDLFPDGLSFTPGSTIAYGTPITAQVYVLSGTDPNGIGTPTGYVTVNDAQTTLALVPLDSGGYATLHTILPAGFHSLTFNYNGDASYLVSALPNSVDLTVAAQPTTTSLTSTGSNDGKGDYVQLVAVVSATSSTGGTIKWPAGTVSFQTSGSNPVTFGSVTVVPGSSGGTLASIANFQLQGSKLPSNPTFLVATFVPTGGNYATSQSNILPITKTSTAGLSTSTTKLATADGKASYLDYDASISFDMTVTGGGAQPTGSVALYDNGNFLGSANLTGSSAPLTINQDPNSGFLPLPIGTNVLTAQYSGDATHYTSTRQILITVLDEGALPDFSMQSNLAFGTISSNSASAPFTLQFTSINNFAALGQRVTLSATLPTGIACSFSPKTISFGSSNFATSQVTCGAANGYTIAQLEPARRPGRFWIASGGATLACVFLLGIPARRRQFRGLLGMALALVMVFGIGAGLTAGLTGCGSNAAASSSHAAASASQSLGADAARAGKSVAPGTYQVLVTGTGPFATRVGPNTATLQTHTIPLQIVVQ